jgi:hypothetical protein
MATIVTAATLSIQVIESITLNGVSRNSSTTVEIASIGKISNRIMSITHNTNGTDIIDIGTAAAAGTYSKTAVKYVRFTNLDDTNFLIIQFTDGSSHHWELKLEAGKSLIIGDTASVDDQADIDNFSASAITKIVGKADTAAIDLEVYIAST